MGASSVHFCRCEEGGCHKCRAYIRGLERQNLSRYTTSDDKHFIQYLHHISGAPFHTRYWGRWKEEFWTDARLLALGRAMENRVRSGQLVTIMRAVMYDAQTCQAALAAFALGGADAVKQMVLDARTGRRELDR